MIVVILPCKIWKKLKKSNATMIPIKAVHFTSST